MHPFHPTPRTGISFLATAKIGLVALLLLILPAFAFAAQVTLAWDANNPAPDGYRLYQRAQGQSYDFTRPAWSGSGTTGTIANLNADTQYYFVVRAYAGNAESGNSNEVGHRTASVNRSPVADAGNDQTVAPLSTVALNGAGSQDPDGDTLSYSWSQTGGPAVQLADNRTARPSFTAPAGATEPTVLTFQLTVRDTAGLSATDTCRVTVAAAQTPQDPPVAQAGGNQSVTSGETVRLNGSGSFHPDGLALTYRWTQTSGRSVSLSYANTAQPRFTAPIVTSGGSTLIFELTVSDPNGLTSSDTCLVQVTAPPAEEPPPPADDPPSDPSNPPEDETPPPTEPDLLPPMQPAIYYPAAGATGVSLTPRLTASAFSGGQPTDTHQRTQWRIQRTRDKQVVMDVTRTYFALDSLWVPYFTLWPGTTYACQVRYFDNHDQASEWSAPVTFTTRTSWFARTAFEMGGVMAFSAPLVAGSDDWMEQADDGKLQTVMTEDGRFLMAVDSMDCTFVAEIEGAAAVAPYDTEPEPPLDDDHPGDLLGYRLLMKGSAQTAEVTLHFAEPIDPRTRWITYGADGEWVDCTDNVEVQPDGLTAIRTIDDGGPEDADGVANGVIVDLLAPVQTSADADTSGKQLDGSGAGSAGGSSGGCFIGTLLP